MRYPDEELWSELAYLAYHLHWELDALLELQHGDRGRMMDEVAELNERSWEEVTQRG